MKNTRSQYLLLFLLSLSTSTLPRVEASVDHLRVVTLHQVALSWLDANTWCGSNHGGHLATARNALDLSSHTTVCQGSNKCWVGLLMRNSVWRWIGGRKNSPLDTPWSSGRPRDGSCSSVYMTELFDQPCSTRLYFLCEKSRLVLVREQKTWEEALLHCRALEASKQMDLLSFHDEEELFYAQEEMALAQVVEVWIGLRWLAGRWLWMDRTAGGDIPLPECPAKGTHCGTLSGRGQHARNCVERRSFFCREQA